MSLEVRLRPIMWAARQVQAKTTEPESVLRRRAPFPGGYLITRLMAGSGARVAKVEDRLVDVDGGFISVRLYRPTGRSPLPVHLFFHGGGWSSGAPSDRDSRCRDLAAGAGCVVVSVDYRLAPEAQYPTAPEDCYRALAWVAERGEELGLDTSRISVGGESAGGNLAAVVCLMARDRNGPRILLQVLDVPATDLTLEQPSTYRLASGYGLTRTAMQQYVSWYLPEPALARHGYASPLHAEDLSGLPPAVITTCEYDPLRDDGESYARRLRQSGVPVVHRCLPGHIHVSFAFVGLLPSARAHLLFYVESLKEAYRAWR